MRRIVLLMVMGIVAVGAMAQNLRGNHFSAEASYNWRVGGPDTKGYDDGFDFWGLTVTGAYRYYLLNGLYVSPELSLYYENHELDVVVLDGTLPPSEQPPSLSDTIITTILMK